MSTGSTRPADSPRWPWILLLAVAPLLPLLAFFTWSGQCVDFAPGAGESYCTSSPSIGWAGAWLLTAVAVIAIGVAVTGLVRRRRRRERRGGV